MGKKCKFGQYAFAEMLFPNIALPYFATCHERPYFSKAGHHYSDSLYHVNEIC